MLQLLIVDDHVHLVESLARTIPWQELGIEKVHKAYSADDALEALQTHPIRIVVTDIRMPGMSGLELISKIRETWKQQVKCIILSGYEDFEYAKEAIVQDAVEYLLKPVEEDELMRAVRRAADLAEKDSRDAEAYRRAVAAMREHLPLLRAELLRDLLKGRRIGEDALAQKLQTFGIPFRAGRPFSILLIRLEQDVYGRDIEDSLPLYEYAIGNIAEEHWQDEFEVWHGKDSFDYLVYLVQARDGVPLERLGAAAERLQENVKKYLKLKMSYLIGRSGSFAADIRDAYLESLSAFRKYINDESELGIRLSAPRAAAPITFIRSLYEPPHLMQLLEVGKWPEIERKMEALFAELESMEVESAKEHMLEAFFVVAGSYSYLAHKSGFSTGEAFGRYEGQLAEVDPFRSLRQFKEWALGMLDSFRHRMERQKWNGRTQLVRQVQDFIEANLHEDVSLQAIADHVYLNPNYLSSIYKLQTGEGISEYLYRIRMEKAVHMLKNTNDKIYAISSRLGFQNTNYFIRIFKRYYDLTPQEYREKLHVTVPDAPPAQNA